MENTAVLNMYLKTASSVLITHNIRDRFSLIFSKISEDDPDRR